MYSILTKEPYSLTLDYIVRLTDWQIWQIHLRPTKKRKRHEEMEGQRVYVSAFEMYWQWLHDNGVSDEEIIERWKRENPQWADEAVILPFWLEQSDGTGQS